MAQRLHGGLDGLGVREAVRADERDRPPPAAEPEHEVQSDKSRLPLDVVQYIIPE